MMKNRFSMKLKLNYENANPKDIKEVRRNEKYSNKSES